MTTDEEFEQLLRQAAAGTVAQQPSAQQCARILERRARGERVRIPAPARRWSRSSMAWVAGLATVAAGLGATVVSTLPRPPRHPEAGQSRPAQTLLAPGPLMAQSASQPAFPPLEAGLGHRLRPGRWIYTADLTREVLPGDTLFVYALVPTTYQGSEAWLVLAGRQVQGGPAEYSDSTWLARDRLDVLEHRSDSLITWQPVPANMLAVLQAATLGSAWAASVPLLGRDQGQTRHGWINLKVYGRETVEVPAGRYTCWKVGFRPSLGFFFWISPDGVPVRQGMNRADDLAFGKMNLALLRYEEP
jgi:hypothetical protein